MLVRLRGVVGVVGSGCRWGWCGCRWGVGVGGGGGGGGHGAARVAPWACSPRRNVIADFCRASTAAARGAAYHAGQSWPLWAAMPRTTTAVRREPARAMVLFCGGVCGAQDAPRAGREARGGVCATMPERDAGDAAGPRRRDGETSVEVSAEVRVECVGRGSEVRVAVTVTVTA